MRRVISIQTKSAVETASLNPKEGSPADIPTADGAKIQTNSETDKDPEEKIYFHKVEESDFIQTKRAVETAPLNPKEGSPADIPTADGAKVQQNSETDKESEEIFNFHKVEDG